jgi:hypothetical protein
MGGEGLSTAAWNAVLKKVVTRVEVSDTHLLFVPSVGEPQECASRWHADGRHAQPTLPTGLATPGPVAGPCEDGRMAKQQELRGEFWLESDPERRVAGHLTYHPKRAGTLSLHAPLRESSGLPRGEYERIKGSVLGGSCLLLNCFDAGASHSEAGPGEWEVHPKIFVNSMLIMPRQHLESPAERFVGASGRFDGLAEFDGRMPFKFGRLDRDSEDEDKPEDGDPWIETITATRLEPRVVETDAARIDFFQGPGSRGGEYRKQTLVSVHSVHVTPHESLPLDDIVDLYTQVRSLIALAMHQDCRFEGPLYLKPEPREGGAEEEAYDSYKFNATWRRGTRHRHPLYNRVLSFDSLTAEGIARWLDLEKTCGHVISRLTSMRYTRRLAYEDALLRVVAAADSLHREVYPRDEFTKSRKMLRELAEYAGYPFSMAVPNVADWAHTVITERDNAAHNKGLDVSKPALATPLVESVYFLVLIALLRKADAPETAFESVRKSQPFVWPMKQVRRHFGGTRRRQTRAATSKTHQRQPSPRP